VVKFTLNGKELEVEPGTTIYEAAKAEGVFIPTFCYHEELSPYGACRLCLVELDSRSGPWVTASCVYEVKEGLVVRTETEMVKNTRKVILELLLARCPDSPEAKEIAANYGVTSTRFTLDTKGNCTLCGLCVRACAEISQRHAISFAGRGNRRRVQTPYEELSDICVGCGACAYVCPTKVIEIREAE
jgi:NADH dehydrogenase/NADH:ubiquinone oxidoreductase subunit G